MTFLQDVLKIPIEKITDGESLIQEIMKISPDGNLNTIWKYAYRYMDKHDIRDKIQLPKDLQERRNAIYEYKKMTRDWIKIPYNTYKVFLEYNRVHQNEAKYLLIHLCAVSGRRSVEILNFGCLFEIEGEYIKYNPAKKVDGQICKFSKNLIIHISPEEFIHKVGKLREFIARYELNPKTLVVSANAYLRRFTNKTITLHSFRGLFLDYHIQQLRKSAHQRNEWGKRWLCQNSTSSTDCYGRYTIDFHRGEM